MLNHKHRQVHTHTLSLSLSLYSFRATAEVGKSRRESSLSLSVWTTGGAHLDGQWTHKTVPGQGMTIHSPYIVANFQTKWLVAEIWVALFPYCSYSLTNTSILANGYPPTYCIVFICSKRSWTECSETLTRRRRLWTSRGKLCLPVRRNIWNSKSRWNPLTVHCPSTSKASPMPYSIS